MKYLSTFSGIEAATVAWEPLGWEPVGFSEIEPFPSAVLQHRYPKTTNYGDINQYHTWDVEPFDLLVGGSPCQSFSVAGLRRGLTDPRGNLMLTYLGVADKFKPEWIVWENVPGVLSSNKGRDFGTFLGALGELGYGWSYRVLDAKHFGVPQRRKRVFVVGHLGDWRRAAAVLFERESLSGNPKSGRSARQAASGEAEASIGGNGAWWDGGQLAGTLTKQNANGAQRMPDKDNFGAVLVHAFKIRSGAAADTGAQGGQVGRVAGKGYLGQDELAFTLARQQDQQIYDLGRELVRRLTPLECERLQGFPDGYTNVPWRGKEHAPDGHRYQALGNSMAVPVMRWIGERIDLIRSL